MARPVSCPPFVLTCRVSRPDFVLTCHVSCPAFVLQVYGPDEDGYTTRNRGTEFMKSPEMLTVSPYTLNPKP